MPFAVEQANAITLSFVVPLLLLVIMAVCGGYRRSWPVLTGMTIGFGSAVVGFALIPFNPFRGYVDVRRRGGRSPKPRELSEAERRVLASCYDPRNRRRGVVAVLGIWALTIVAWRMSILLGMQPTVGNALAPIQVVASIVAMGLPLAGWVGISAVTHELRKDWPKVVSSGPAWPIDMEFPGPWRELVKTFVTGELPNFMARTPESEGSQVQ